MVCLDLESVLVPEIWITVAERTGIDALCLTTRDMADYDELMALRQKEAKLSKSQKLMEVFTTYPNMLKRMKHLSTLAV